MNTNSVYKCLKSLVRKDKLRKFRIVKLGKTLIEQVLTAGNYDLKKSATYVVKVAQFNYFLNLQIF